MATRLERSCRTRAVAAQNRDTVTSDKSWTMGRGSVDDLMSDYHDLLNIGENTTEQEQAISQGNSRN